MTTVEKLAKYNNMYMDVAYRISLMSHCIRCKVGAILVHDGNIISIGWNGTPENTCNQCEDDTNTTLDTVLHAELNCLRKIQNHSCLPNSTLFVTTAPCLPCADEIMARGIKHVVYGELYRLPDGVNRLIQHGVTVECTNIHRTH